MDYHVIMQVVTEFIQITAVAGSKVSPQKQLPFTHSVPPSTGRYNQSGVLSDG
ncbi:MAG: hypothetical protein WA997_07845 [Anaerolineales bacterium]